MNAVCPLPANVSNYFDTAVDIIFGARLQQPAGTFEIICIEIICSMHAVVEYRCRGNTLSVTISKSNKEI